MVGRKLIIQIMFLTFEFSFFSAVLVNKNDLVITKHDNIKHNVIVVVDLRRGVTWRSFPLGLFFTIRKVFIKS